MRFINYITFFTLLVGCSSNEPGNCGKMPQGNRNSFIRLISILPNPNGPDDFKESFTIKNFGDTPINLKGWKIIHNGSSLWHLETIGELMPCRQVTVFNLRAESLGNNNDFIKLIDDENIQVQSIEWSNVPEGKEIIPE